MSRFPFVLAVTAVVLCATPADLARACPFCSAVGPTFAEQMADADAVVLARLSDAPPVLNTLASNCGPAIREFQVQRILRGGGLRTLQATFFGAAPVGTLFLVRGHSAAAGWDWSLPLEAEPVLADYLVAVSELDPSAPGRLRFFHDFLEHPHPLIADDACCEFSQASYAEIRKLGPQMPRERLLTWIADPQIPCSRHKLYLTMLGVCGRREDAVAVEKVLEAPARSSELDAAWACYVALLGDEGLAVLEDRCLRAPVDPSLASAAVAALRFHGEERRQISRSRLARSLAMLLDHPSAAELALADLARWQDWSHVDRVVRLFVTCPADTLHRRVRLARYLLACPLPEAAAHLADLRQLDAERIEQAVNRPPSRVAK